ncbi:MAG TPA: GNAT family protein [Microbacteriaceae bacterium]|jgi:RimJ/RimL family protein N-acetyltransferase|nr:GNAT family protein [Microbacteriaceae bacterium]
MPALLRSEHLTLSEPDARDIDALFTYCSDREILRWIPLPEPYERAHAEYFVNTFVPEGRTNGTRAEWALRLEPDAPLIGVVELQFEPVHSAVIGFWIAAEQRGRGLITEAINAVVDHAFEPEGRALIRIRWEAVIGNDASARVARRTGFQFEGTARAGIVFRGERKDGWHASLLATDTREPKDGWPPEIGRIP